MLILGLHVPLPAPGRAIGSQSEGGGGQTEWGAALGATASGQQSGCKECEGELRNVVPVCGGPSFCEVTEATGESSQRREGLGGGVECSRKRTRGWEGAVCSGMTWTEVGGASSGAGRVQASGSPGPRAGLCPRMT